MENKPEPNDAGKPINPFNCGECKSMANLFCEKSDSLIEAKGDEPNGELEFGICIGEDEVVIAATNYYTHCVSHLATNLNPYLSNQHAKTPFNSIFILTCPYYHHPQLLKITNKKQTSAKIKMSLGKNEQQNSSKLYSQ